MVDYRLSPANPFPSALIDALSVYQHLIMEGICEPDMLFFAGDSAGGNLCLTTTMWLRDHPELDLPTPKGLVLLSPWLDQHRSSPTISLDDEFTACLTDGMKVGDVLEEPGPLPYIKYAKGAKHTDPLVSPLYDNGNLPPIMIAVGTVDRFIGECLAEGIKQVQKGDTVIMGASTTFLRIFANSNRLVQITTKTKSTSFKGTTGFL